MARKPVSWEDKRKRTLEYLFDTKEVFNLKELETQLSKQKGIVSQAVKEVVTSLVDDGMIDSDKIGSGNFFWAFPSKATIKRQTKIDALETKVNEVNNRIRDAAARKRKATEGREPSQARTQKLQRIQELRDQAAELDARLAKYAEFDPERVQVLDRGANECRQHANRWTDNAHIMWSFFKDKGVTGEMTQEQFFEQFGLPKDLDELP